jgi:hypothetical protein
MASMKLAILFVSALASLNAQGPCVLSSSHDQFQIAYVSGHPKLTLDESSPQWAHGLGESLSKDCYRQIEYPAAKTTIEAFWTDTDLYVLFRCPYAELNLFLPANHAEARMSLWDRDVVEMFLGDDWQNIGHYREFEIAPTGDWIDLAIDLDRKSFDHTWRSGWETLARVDETHKVWYAAARIPLKAVSDKPVIAGTKWRVNFYRIDGVGGNDMRHFMCWQPTCNHQHGNHTPESFGTLVFGR